MHAIISRAVRMPRELRIDTRRVEISRNVAGDLIVHPVLADRGAVVLEALEDFDAEYAALLEDVLADSAFWCVI